MTEPRWKTQFRERYEGANIDTASTRFINSQISFIQELLDAQEQKLEHLLNIFDQAHVDTEKPGDDRYTGNYEGVKLALKALRTQQIPQEQNNDSGNQIGEEENAKR